MRTGFVEVIRSRAILLCAMILAGAVPQSASNIPRVAAAPPGAAQQGTAVASSRASDKVIEALGKPTNVQFLDVPLSDAIDFLAMRHNITIRIDRNSLQGVQIVPEKKRVTLRLNNYPMQTVLKLLETADELGFYVDGDELVVTTRELADSHVEQTEYDVRHAVRSGVSIEELGEMIFQLANPATWKEQGGLGELHRTATKLTVRHRADVQWRIRRFLTELERALVAVPGLFEDDQLVVKSYPLDGLQKGLPDADLGTWLREWLLAATAPEFLGSADLKIEGGKLLLKQSPWVHAVVAKRLAAIRESAKREPGRPRTREDFTSGMIGLQAEAQRQTIRKQLAKRISVMFLDLAVEDVLVYLKEAGGINVWVGHIVAKRGGIRLDKPVTFAANEALSGLLDKALSTLPLEWYVLEPGLIVVAPPLAGAAAMELRVYGIQELRDSGQTVEQLTALVKDLDPDSWAAPNSGASIRPLSPGLLIVNQTRRMHCEIEKSFDLLAIGRQEPK